MSITIRDNSGKRLAGRWRALFAFAFARVVDDSEGGMISALFPSIREALGLSLIDLSLLVNANKIISAVLTPIWGMAADNYNRKRILVFATGFWGLWTMAIGLAPNFGWLIGLYTIASIGSVASMPIVMSMVSDLFPDKNRGRAMGAFGAIAVILSVAAVPLVGLFANPEAWHYGFYLIGSFSVISGILIFIFFQDPGRGAAEEEVAGIAYTPREVQPIDFVRLLKIPTLTFLFLQKFFNGGLLIWSFGVVYMVDIYAFDNDEAIIIMIVPLLLGNILGNIFGGVLGDRLNQRFPRSGRIALLQSAFFFSAVMSFLATQISWGTTSGFVSTFFFWGIFLSFGTGLDRPMIAAVTPPELRSTAFGVLMSVGDALASLVLVSITGWAGNLFGLQTAFLVLVSGVMFIRSFIWFIAYIPYSRDIDQMKHFMSK